MQEICIYLDGLSIHDDNARRVDIPNHIERAFNNITDELNTIINRADIAHRDIRQYQTILNNTNAQVQGLRNELANARNWLILLDITLDNERIEANQDQETLQDTLNNEREACRRRVEMMTNALNDEIRTRQNCQAELVNAQRERDDASRTAHR